MLKEKKIYFCKQKILHVSISHLHGAVFDVDLGHVDHITQALNAVPLPGPYRF